jgi:hypothetical protein
LPNGSDKTFHRAMIFHAGRVLNTTANIHSMWPNRLDGMANILRVQTTRKNEESRECQRCSRGRPIARPSSPAAEIGMVCINEHVTIRKERDVFRAESRMSQKHSNHAKLGGQFTHGFRREVPVQLNASRSRGLSSLSNFLGVPVNENTDCINISRQRLDNLPGNVGFNVARTSRIKVKANQRRAELYARFGIPRVRDAADFDLYWPHGKNSEARKL